MELGQGDTNLVQGSDLWPMKKIFLCNVNAHGLSKMKGSRSLLLSWVYTLAIINGEKIALSLVS